MTSEPTLSRRLQLAREGSRVQLSAARAERLSGALVRRRRSRQQRRLAAGGVTALAAVVVLLVVLRPAPQVQPGSQARAPIAPAVPARARPRLLEAPPAGSGPLEDVATDAVRAQVLWASFRRARDTHATIP